MSDNRKNRDASAGVRLLLTGLIVVGVITAAGGQKALR
ncbi:hypothetical protein ABID19_002316 [Mesorhizobium robiniae]|uniref:Uncharacterized protein n=1 Tax=Mesorhizobium robiniae TaxID=559315 RepID=A0ABV2GLW5_9HYPH